MVQVRAVYEFEAQPNSGELSITVNEVLTVIREGIDGGWLEGRNAKGQHGLFPESYVVKIVTTSHTPPVEKPSSDPSKLPTYAVPPSDLDWIAPPTPAHYPSLAGLSQEQSRCPAASNQHIATSQDDDDFDDWTEDEDDVSENIRPGIADDQRYPSENKLATDLSSHKQSTVRVKSINRFSNFVKSGMEAYILSTTKLTTKSDEQHEIKMIGDNPEWLPIAQAYSCVVDKPKKESKLKGLKSFIAYSVTPSLSGIQVSRRYKHFDWLYEQMSAKYILIPLPPLPEKQVAGRYEEDLIEHRKNVLQIWVNKVCRHPVLSKSDVWIHFLTCTDAKQWKSGKRKAEKDEYVGGNFLHSVTVPMQPLDGNKVESQVELFLRSMRSLDDSVRVMFDRVTETHKRMTGPYKSNWQKMAAAFAGLGYSFELDPVPQNATVTAALKETAQVFHKIGDDHEESSKKDIDPLLDALYSYKGILAGIPEIVNVHKSAMSKLRENEKLSIEGRISNADLEKVKERVDSVSYAVFAEISFQNRERGEDFKQMMASFLDKQANFYTNIGKQLAELAESYR